MALERDGTRRAVRLASALVAGLFLLVLVANVLWVLPSPTSINQPRMPPTASPFPQFRMGPILHVVTLEPDANLSTRLLMTSLQGIVNREQVELYLDVPKGAVNTSRTLSFLSSRYNVSSAPMTMHSTRCIETRGRTERTLATRTRRKSPAKRRDARRTARRVPSCFRAMD